MKISTLILALGIFAISGANASDSTVKPVSKNRTPASANMAECFAKVTFGNGPDAIKAEQKIASQANGLRFSARHSIGGRRFFCFSFKFRHRVWEWLKLHLA